MVWESHLDPFLSHQKGYVISLNKAEDHKSRPTSHLPEWETEAQREMT